MFFLKSWEKDVVRFQPQKKWVKGAMGVYIYIICIYVFIYLFICLNVVRKIHKTNNTKIK